MKTSVICTVVKELDLGQIPNKLGSIHIFIDRLYYFNSC